jgi:2-desacetyl-2-hydroxyethyl bacteriochlorophyllide A dehydrogenase
MKAVKLSAPRQASVVDEPAPTAGPGEVVIRIGATGLCGSDLSTWLGHHPFRRPPVVLGHEAAGTVVAVGADVTDIAPGTRVALCPLIACGRCDSCRRGQGNLCRNRRVPGVGWGGTYADFVVAPADRAFPVPDTVSMTAAALIEPAAVALRACRRAGIGPGTRLGVLGAGGIGTMCALVANHLGADPIVVTDVSGAKLARLADAVPVIAVPLPGEDPVKAALSATAGEGLDTVLVTAAAPGVLDQAVAMTRPGGTLVLVALPGAPAPLDVDACAVRELSLHGTYAYQDRDFADAVAMVGDGMNVLAALTHELPLDEAPEIFEQIMAGLDYTKIVFTNDRAAGYPGNGLTRGRQRIERPRQLRRPGHEQRVTAGQRHRLDAEPLPAREPDPLRIHHRLLLAVDVRDADVRPLGVVRHRELVLRADPGQRPVHGLRRAVAEQPLRGLPGAHRPAEGIRLPVLRGHRSLGRYPARLVRRGQNAAGNGPGEQDRVGVLPPLEQPGDHPPRARMGHDHGVLAAEGGERHVDMVVPACRHVVDRQVDGDRVVAKAAQLGNQQLPGPCPFERTVQEAEHRHRNHLWSKRSVKSSINLTNDTRI